MNWKVKSKGIKLSLKKTKKPWLAGLLNVIPPLGYLYLGKRKGFSYLLILSWIFLILDAIVNTEVLKSPMTVLGTIGTVFAFSAFIYDAYFMAKNS